MSNHPYRDLPDYAYWRRGVANAPDGTLDPVVDVPFRFGPKDRVATAGSCFAQHIGRYLQAAECGYLVTEPPHPLLKPEAARLTNYGTFTARYGNIYTARQLLQLFDRAYGQFTPREDMWKEGASVFIDPFRPNIQPNGFNSEKEFRIDRARHFQAVRAAFETLDVFVFTLGLTEAWRSKDDGAVFPICPGVAGGTFSPQRHEFVNFDIGDVVADLNLFFNKLRTVNPRAKTILTVSPVPLAATAERRHVLVSTVYSKSVLRVAAESVTRTSENVAYFPSYEIVASGFAGDYFAADRRSITEDGVAHVMRVFAAHFIQRGERSMADFMRRAMAALKTKNAPTAIEAELAARRAAFEVMCDEEALDIPADASLPDDKSV
jgi:hypothetical protein